MRHVKSIFFFIALTAMPSVAMAQTADTAPSELVSMLLASWGQWSIVVGLGLLVAIQVWRKVKPQVWGALHPVVRRLLPPTVSALTTAAIGLATGASWSEFGQVFLVQWIALSWAADLLGGSTFDLKNIKKGTTISALFLTVFLIGGCQYSCSKPAAAAIDSACATTVTEVWDEACADKELQDCPEAVIALSVCEEVIKQHSLECSK